MSAIALNVIPVQTGIRQLLAVIDSHFRENDIAV